MYAEAVRVTFSNIWRLVRMRTDADPPAYAYGRVRTRVRLCI